MSYDIYLQIDTGDPEGMTDVLDVGNHTSNCHAMWHKALGYSLSDLHDKNAGESVADLERAVAHMEAPENAAAYRAMTPENKWGSHSSATRYLRDVLNACRKHPKCTIYVSH